MLGFSAGGHLATALGVNFNEGDPDSQDPIGRVSSRPDFMVVCYTVPAPLDKREGREHGWKPVTEETPPAFMWVTHRDQDRPAKTAEFYQMLHKAGVEAELHIFGGWGPHGTGLAPGEPGIGAWPELLERWLRRNGFLTGKKRVPVSGQVFVDGEPLHRGWVTFVPVESPGAPVASDYITHRDDGRFEIKPEFGPVPGRHRVEVYRVAKDFLTVPSMGDAEQFTRSASGELLQVVVTAGENQYDFKLKSPGD